LDRSFDAAPGTTTFTIRIRSRTCTTRSRAGCTIRSWRRASTVWSRPTVSRTKRCLARQSRRILRRLRAQLFRQARGAFDRRRWLCRQQGVPAGPAPNLASNCHPISPSKPTSIASRRLGWASAITSIFILSSTRFRPSSGLVVPWRRFVYHATSSLSGRALSGYFRRIECSALGTVEPENQGAPCGLAENRCSAARHRPYDLYRQAARGFQLTGDALSRCIETYCDSIISKPGRIRNIRSA